MSEELKTVRDVAENGKTTNSQGWLLKSICKVLIELTNKTYNNGAISAAARDPEFWARNEARKEADRKFMMSEAWEDTNPDSIKHYGDKPMKATIIYYLKDEPHTEAIDTNGHEHIAEAVSEWCKDQGCAPRFVHFVHYDGVLFEYTSKPVLAEVGTGIEI